MRYWYGFGSGDAAGGREMAATLGGKGANLAEMSRIGIPVPPGFILPTSLCRPVIAAGELGPEAGAALEEGLAFLEASLDGPRLGDPERPLLVSVRSGAPISMPGMMDTVLNLGLNRETLEALGRASANRRFALDSYRRLIQMFGDVVKGVERSRLEAPLVRLKGEAGVDHDRELSEAHLERLATELEEIYAEETGERFPDAPLEQIRQAVTAVFLSWDGKRARTYRALHAIPDEPGTAATVQAMVFGNLGADCATGVAFSRHPATGDPEPMGEWLPDAQGEDVVAGVRTPGPLSRNGAESDVPSLEEAMPPIHAELVEMLGRLERHFGDLQDVEFTVESGKLWLLQTRAGKR
ncbi:MAG: PEP/pyruvate-binding domain-containing protein, partial [Thermoanaerobaculia bacterium]|nr:PEP/pyruvate-binding domain-containing protein [Thermoanaerobaculia bacterium]